MPMNKLTQMDPMLDLLTAKQKPDLNNAYKTGGMRLRPAKKQMQHAGFWGALASIGIPLAMNLLPKLFGKGLQVDRSRSCRSIPVFVPPKTNYEIPPIHGQWPMQKGFGIKKRKPRKGKGLITSMSGIPQSQTWNKLPILGQLI